LIDATNRLRNLLGHYRYVSYQMRLWALQAKLARLRRSDEERFLNNIIQKHHLQRPWLTLDLGCGSYPRNPFGAELVLGCDIRSDLDSRVKSCNLATDPIPEEDESVNFITAYDFIEHIPRILLADTTIFPFIRLMSEIHRVLKPSGLFFARTPYYPTSEVFQDPTHINYITNNTFPYYFCWHPYGGPWARMYGFQGQFALIRQRRMGASLFTLLEKMP